MRFDKETKLEVWLALRPDGELGSGSAMDPYDTSSPTLFVERMRSFVENTTIHLGPGVFQVPAYSPEGRSWHPKSGQRILGAGMFITTLKVVGATNHDYLNMAIRNDPFVQIEGYSGLESGPFLRSFEVADLTVDCNMREHIGKQVAIGGIHLTGRHVRLRRTRAIDFGTEREIVEAFVLGTAGAHVLLPEPFDCVIEDCVIERPSPNSWYSHSCFILFADDRAFHRHCGIRRCLLNHEYADRPVAIASITYSGTTATALTKTPHRRSTGEWVVVTGALVENAQSGLSPDYNPFNGSYRITVLDERRFQYTMPIVPVAEPTGDMWLGRSSSQIIGIKTQVPTPPAPDPDPSNPGEQGVSVTSLGGGRWEVTVITERPHWQVPGHNVLLTNVTVGLAKSPVLNDLFRITEVVNPTKLKFIVTTNPGNPDSDQVGQAFIGRFGSNGVGVDAGIGAVAEHNRVFDARFPNYHDSFDSRDLVIRREYYHGAVAGIYQALLSPGTRRAGSALVRKFEGGVRKAVFTTHTPHNLQTGDTVKIYGAVFNGTYERPDNPFNSGPPDNDRFTVTVPPNGSTTFEYVPQPTDGSGEYLVNEPWIGAMGSPVFAKEFTGTVWRNPSNYLQAIFSTGDTDPGYKIGEYVTVEGTNVPQNLKGTWRIVAVKTDPPPYEFTCQINADPETAETFAASCVRAPTPAQSIVRQPTTPPSARLTTQFEHGLAVGEFVSVFGATTSTPYGPTFLNPFNGAFKIKAVPTNTSFDYEINVDPGQDPTGSVKWMRANAAALVSNGANQATFTTAFPHHLAAGDGIVVDRDQDAFFNERVFSGGAPYDGGFAIKWVPSPNSLTYEMAGTAANNADPSALQIVSRWQVGSLLAYRNLIDLRDLRQVSMAYDSAPEGIVMAGNSALPPYTFGHVLLRNNVIRKADGPGTPSLDAEIPGIVLQSCDNGIVAGNVMDLTKTDVVNQYRCGISSYFDNQYQSGFLIEGFVRDASRFVNDLSVDAALAVVEAT